MSFVRYPRLKSKLGSKRGSAYASGMLIVSPVAATVPAIPLPRGRTISSPSTSWATSERSVHCGSHTDLAVQDITRQNVSDKRSNQRLIHRPDDVFVFNDVIVGIVPGGLQ